MIFFTPFHWYIQSGSHLETFHCIIHHSRYFHLSNQILTELRVSLWSQADLFSFSRGGNAQNNSTHSLSSFPCLTFTPGLTATCLRAPSTVHRHSLYSSHRGSLWSGIQLPLLYDKDFFCMFLLYKLNMIIGESLKYAESKMTKIKIPHNPGHIL